MPGAAIGDVSRVPQDLVAAMRTVGLTHITAVSGSHFALLGGAVLALTGALALPRGLRSLIGVAVLTGLVLLVHPQPSVVRAAVMGAVGCLGLVVGRRSSAVPALATAVVVLLVVDPWLSRSAGFALSVLATGGIVLMAARLTSLLQHVLPRWLAIAVSVPVAAQAVCAPVLVLLDPAVSVYAVPANVLAAPALVPATLLGVATTVVAPWWPAAATGLATGAGGATWWVASVARTGAALPGAQLPWDGGPLGVAALVAFDAALLIPLLGGGRLVRERRPWILAVAALLLPGVLPEVRSAVLRLFV